jgi:prepilin peptidase CpaA
MRFRKIFNWLTAPAMAIGLGLSFLAGGFSGVLYGVIGIGIALLAFGWMWGLGALGAGDVKLLMAFSSLSGAAASMGRGAVSFAVDLVLLSILVGGAIAFGILVWKGRIKAFFTKFYRFFLTYSNRHLETEFPKADPSLKMPFGVSISIAAVWLWFWDPLARLGAFPWR